jgi:2-iminobutanoate/2-iminopropanoate deaminase
MNLRRKQILAAVVLCSTAAALLIGCAPAQTKQVISTINAPPAGGPYSQAIQAGSLVFVAGQVPFNPKTKVLSTGSIEEQTAQVLDNIKAILEAGGLTMANVVSTTVFMKNIDDFSKMNTTYAKYFGDAPPARATIEASRLPRDVLIEISAIAAK